MLTINTTQMNLFERQAMQRFEQQVAVHLRTNFPQRCAAMSEEQRLGLVRHAIARGRHHGLSSERDLVLYADVALVLGARFDEDESFDWAREILADPFIVSPALRVDLLHERAIEHVSAPAQPTA